MFEFQHSNQTLGFSLLEVQEKEETILERQVLEVIRVIFSSYTKDLRKLMDKPIACILFFATLELNIVDKEKKNKMWFMWDNISIRRWSILPKCKSSSFSQMKIALLVAMWNAIFVASLYQNNFSLLDWLRACTFYGRSCFLTFSATMNQHPPVHHEGWMISGQEIIFLLSFNSLANHGGYFSCCFCSLPSY